MAMATATKLAATNNVSALVKRGCRENDGDEIFRQSLPKGENE
jgi:hypothetical protein